MDSSRSYTGGTDGYPQTSGTGSFPPTAGATDQYGTEVSGRSTNLEQASVHGGSTGGLDNRTASSMPGSTTTGSVLPSATSSVSGYGTTAGGSTATAGGFTSSSMPSTMASTGTSAEGDRTQAERASGGQQYKTLASGTPSGVTSDMISGTDSGTTGTGTTNTMTSSTDYSGIGGDRTIPEQAAGTRQYDTLASGTPSGVDTSKMATSADFRNEYNSTSRRP